MMFDPFWSYWFLETWRGAFNPSARHGCCRRVGWSQIRFLFAHRRSHETWQWPGGHNQTHSDDPHGTWRRWYNPSVKKLGRNAMDRLKLKYESWCIANAQAQNILNNLANHARTVFSSFPKVPHSTSMTICGVILLWWAKTNGQVIPFTPFDHVSAPNGKPLMFPPSPAKTHSWIICVCSYAFSHYMYIIYILSKDI